MSTQSNNKRTAKNTLLLYFRMLFMIVVSLYTSRVVLNVLSIKRAFDYETIGGLFKDVYMGVHELTVVEKIWNIILEVVAVVAEMIWADSDELTMQVIECDKRLAALRAYAQTV